MVHHIPSLLQQDVATLFSEQAALEPWSHSCCALRRDNISITINSIASLIVRSVRSQVGHLIPTIHYHFDLNSFLRA
jgi:hypothetical protein